MKKKQKGLWKRSKRLWKERRQEMIRNKSKEKRKEIGIGK